MGRQGVLGTHRLTKTLPLQEHLLRGLPGRWPWWEGFFQASESIKTFVNHVANTKHTVAIHPQRWFGPAEDVGIARTAGARSSGHTADFAVQWTCIKKQLGSYAVCMSH